MTNRTPRAGFPGDPPVYYPGDVPLTEPKNVPSLMSMPRRYRYDCKTCGAGTLYYSAPSTCAFCGAPMSPAVCGGDAQAQANMLRQAADLLRERAAAREKPITGSSGEVRPEATLMYRAASVLRDEAARIERGEG